MGTLRNATGFVAGARDTDSSVIHCLTLIRQTVPSFTAATANSDPFVEGGRNDAATILPSSPNPTFGETTVDRCHSFESQSSQGLRMLSSFEGGWYDQVETKRDEFRTYR